MSVLSNKNFKELLDNLIRELSNEFIKSFKIGVTESIVERQNDSDYTGYQLFRLAYIDSDKAKSVEEEVISFFLSSSVKNKCENNLKAAGAGQVKDAKELYIAIRATRSTDRQYYLDVISILKDENIKI